MIDDNLKALCELWQKKKKALIGNLNINLSCSKFDHMQCLLKGKVDILTITECKLGSFLQLLKFL